MDDRAMADIWRRLLAPHPGILKADDGCDISLAGGYSLPPEQLRPGEALADRVTLGDLRRAGVLPPKEPG